jgi:hypothetical protein
MKPFFLTGANARIKLNGATLAFATDISYAISVQHASPRVLGRFEVEVHQPLTYDVVGSFTIIKYTKDADSFLNGDTPNNVNNLGSGAGSFFNHSGLAKMASVVGLPGSNGSVDRRAQQNFIPSRLYQSAMFDIEIYQKVDNGQKLDYKLVAFLQDCRLTDSEFSMSKKTEAKQRFSFICRYAHEDTFIARKSGVGQELT